MQKMFLLIGLSMLIACANPTKKPISGDTQKKASQAPVEQLDIEQLIRKIDKETADMTANTSNRIIEEVHACEIKDYNGQKKYVFCFAGGRKAQEGSIYYLNGKPMAAFYTLEQYNASPANLAKFDETKTVKKQVKLYFKNGDLNAIDKVLDMNNKLVVMDEEQTKEWGILVAALQ